MKAFLLALVSEGSPVSSLRAMSLLVSFFACCIACYGLYRGSDMAGLAELCGVFLAAAFGGKVAQKHVELKARENEKDEAKD